MSTLSKKATIYLDPDIHRALKIKAAATCSSISELINDAICHEFAMDEEDLRTFEERVGEPTVSFEKVLKDLKANGKV